MVGFGNRVVLMGWMCVFVCWKCGLGMSRIYLVEMVGGWRVYELDEE